MIDKDRNFILCHKYHAVNNEQYDENIREFWRLNMFGFYLKIGSIILLNIVIYHLIILLENFVV